MKTGGSSTSHAAAPLPKPLHSVHQRNDEPNGSMMAWSREHIGALLGLIGVIIFSATLPVTRLALDGFDVVTITAGRAALAGVLAAIVLVAMRRPIPVRHLPRLSVIALCLTVGFPGFTALAMQTVASSHGAVVLGILPLATAVAATLVAGERPSIAFFAVAIVGAALVSLFTILEAGGLEIGVGDIALFIAGAAAALGYALSGKIARDMPGWEVISWAVVIALPVSLTITALAAGDQFARAPTHALWAFVYLGVMSQFIGFCFWNAGLAMGGVAKVGQIQLLQTFFTLGFAAVLLSESIDAVTLGFAVLVAVVVIIGRRTRVTAAPAVPR